MRRLPINKMKAIVASFFILSITAFAETNVYKYLGESEKNIADVSSYSELLNKDKSAFYSFVNNNINASDSPYMREYLKSTGASDKDIDTYFRILKNDLKLDKGTAIFFMTSNSVPKSHLRNFIIGFDKIKKKNPNIKGYFVFNGFLKQPGGMNSYLDELGVNGSSVVGKALPLMFERLNLKEVPAFVISECPMQEFKQADCDHKIISVGAIPFEKFLDTVNEKSTNTDYKKLYYDLIDPN